jgi:hypothetical protein
MTNLYVLLQVHRNEYEKKKPIDTVTKCVQNRDLLRSAN